MITISACLIVKNEEKCLADCLMSLKDIADEIIIVDTGSTDKTKEIALRFTNQIYDFKWQNDFAAARNYSFSKATKEYIYTADADEIIDEENRNTFIQLKDTLLPEIEIVQMYYGNQLQFGTTYNYDREYRPKLFKRIRNFIWKDPIHETIQLDPIIYDSEITITHNPHESHASRDFTVIQNVIERGERLSAKLLNMYAKELFIAGEDKDFLNAEAYFKAAAVDESRGIDEIRDAICVAAKASRLNKNVHDFFTLCLKGVAEEPCAEICYELGNYYYDAGEYKEAKIWYYNAAYETECRLCIQYGTILPIERLAKVCSLLGDSEQSMIYQSLLEEQIQKS